jgi:hypothetical protein
MRTHVDSLDVVSEEFLDLFTLDRGVDNDIVTTGQLGSEWQKNKRKHTPCSSLLGW